MGKAEIRMEAGKGGAKSRLRNRYKRKYQTNPKSRPVLLALAILSSLSKLT